MKKKLFCIALSVLFVFTGTAACSCNGDKPDDSYIKNTDIVLFDEGKTDYKIVIPANPSDSEAFAAEEAACFMKLSSGADFETVSDKDRNFNENDKVISVGNTSLLKGSGLEIKKSETGDSGFIIKRFGNTVIIAGANEGYGYGNIYGVYEFLRYEIGYEVYAADEIKVSGEKKGFVKDFDYSYVPTFNERSITEYVLEKDYVYRTRMKLVSPFTSEFGLWGHSNALYILPYSVYGAKHPAWYTATGDVNGRYQLCFTNKEMRAEYVKRLKEIIDEKPDSKYFMLGHEDTSLYCNCEKCLAEIEKYKQPSGLQIAFINKVVDEIMPWFNEKYPGREIEFVIFAYLFSEKPPVEKTADGNYAPTHENCIPRDNVAVMLAPIRIDWSKPVTEGVNSGSYENIKQWAAVADHLMLWKYSFYASDSVFVPFNNLNAYKEINDSLREFNVIYLMEEADMAVPTASFEELRIYVQANMLWNGDRSVNDLIKKFMKGYYGEAGEEMYAYYIALNTWQETLNNTQNKCNGDVWDTPSAKAEYWPHELLLKFDEALDKAEAKIAGLKNTDADEYEKLLARIDKERLLNLYFRLSFYRNGYTNSELSVMINEFERLTVANGISAVGTASEAQSSGDFIKELRSKLR